MYLNLGRVQKHIRKFYFSFRVIFKLRKLFKHSAVSLYYRCVFVSIFWESVEPSVTVLYGRGGAVPKQCLVI